MSITKASVLKTLLKTAKLEMVSKDFIPDELEVRNLATLFTGKDQEDSEDTLSCAWSAAKEVARKEGYTKLTLAAANHGGFSSGALVFRGQRIETQAEFDQRVDWEAEWKATELRREASALSRQNKKDRDELARLQDKLGVK